MRHEQDDDGNVVVVDDGVDGWSSLNEAAAGALASFDRDWQAKVHPDAIADLT